MKFTAHVEVFAATDDKAVWSAKERLGKRGGVLAVTRVPNVHSDDDMRFTVKVECEGATREDAAEFLRGRFDRFVMDAEEGA